MACGDRYRHLAVTSNGYTFDNPFGSVGIYPYDYIQWKDLARKLVELADAHYKALGEYESQVSGGTHYPKWNELQPMQNDMVGDLDDLPWTALSGSSGEEGISKAQDVISTALCLLERADDALVGYGQLPPPVPGVLPKPREPRDDENSWLLWVLLGAGGVITLGAVSYMLVQRGRRREPPKAPPSRPRAVGDTRAQAIRPSENPEAFFAFIDKGGKRHLWSRPQLSDTILESEAWDDPRTIKKIDRLKPGQSITVGGESLVRLSGSKRA